jgi:hypothetical protein
MSFKKSSKKDEEDLKEYVEAKATIAAEPSTDVKGLQKELGGSFSAFANSDENYRKRVLKEEYAAKKLKYGWQYDQPIKSDV